MSRCALAASNLLAICLDAIGISVTLKFAGNGLGVV